MEFRAEVGSRPVGTVFNSCCLASRRQRGVNQAASSKTGERWLGRLKGKSEVMVKVEADRPGHPG